MNKLNVPSEIPSVLGFVGAMWARKWSLSGVSSQVLLEPRHERKLSRTEGTQEVCVRARRAV